MSRVLYVHTEYSVQPRQHSRGREGAGRPPGLALRVTGKGGRPLPAETQTPTPPNFGPCVVDWAILEVDRQVGSQDDESEHDGDKEAGKGKKIAILPLLAAFASCAVVAGVWVSLCVCVCS